MVYESVKTESKDEELRLKDGKGKLYFTVESAFDLLMPLVESSSLALGY